MHWNKNSSPLSLICDIGSASVAIAVVDSSKSIPHIVFSETVPLLIGESFNQSELEKNVYLYFSQAVASVSSALQKELSALPDKRITHASIVFSSPWYATKISTVIIEKSKAFLLDEKTVEDIIFDEERKFEQEALSGGYAAHFKQDLHVIERELVRVKLNGYETTNPYLKKVLHAELSIGMSLVPHKLLLTLVTMLKDTFHIEHSRSYTFPLVSFGTISTLFPHDTDFISLDITGEMTDVTYVEDHSIIGSHSFPFGRNELVRNVCTKLGISPDLALSYFSLQTAGTLDAEVQKALQGVLGSYLHTWYGVLEKTPVFIRAKEKGTKRIFLTAHADVSDIFMNYIIKDSRDHFLPLFISDTALDPFISYEKHVTHDPFIAIDTLFLHTK